jgi:hypothetical protein
VSDRPRNEGDQGDLGDFLHSVGNRMASEELVHLTAIRPPLHQAPRRNFRTVTGLGQNPLDLRSAVPLHVRPVLTYAEVAALGIAPERSLRRLVAMGRVKRAVLRVGRSVRFVVRDLIDELRQENG